MSFKSTLFIAATSLALALPAFADGMMVSDAYARASTPKASSGAAFMVIMNHTDTDDRLIDVTSPVAERAELHTHEAEANGVMRMRRVEEGFELPKGGTLELVRGGSHVMLLGLKQPMVQDEMVPVTLTFEKAGKIEIEVPVDLERRPTHGESDHGSMDHGKMGHDMDDSKTAN